MRRKVRDVMTTKVVAASPTTPYKELVRLLAERKVSAVPVVDERRHVLGVVSEADLLVKQEYPYGLGEALWHESKRRRAERAKAGGAVAADLMTAPPVTVGRDTSVVEAARRLHAEGVKRLLVEDALGRLVGIVSRSDLLAGFLRPDQEIRREILDEVIREDLLMGPDRFDVHVRDGVVVLQGSCERRSLIPILVRAVHGVEGVVRVENRLGYDVDDTRVEQYGGRAFAS
jgi:CBS domain-containing protein